MARNTCLHYCVSGFIPNLGLLSLSTPRDSLLELQVGIMIACMPAINHLCHRLLPKFVEIRGKFSHYYRFRLFTTRQFKSSEMKNDTLAGVVELYESSGPTSGHPTQKDFHETTMTVPARSLDPQKYRGNHVRTDSDTSQLINETRWYN